MKERWDRDKIRDCVGKSLINGQIEIPGCAGDEGDPKFVMTVLFGRKEILGRGTARQAHEANGVEHSSLDIWTWLQMSRSTTAVAQADKPMAALGLSIPDPPFPGC